MEDNPYRSPPGRSGQQIDQAYARDAAISAVRGPAVWLIAASVFCLVCICAALAFDAFMLLSGAVRNWPNGGGGISKEVQVQVRIVWGTAILIANSVILVGAVKMKRLQNHGLAMAAAVLAVVPCVGPCYCLGIPLGIWALTVLNRPDVRQAFRVSVYSS